MSRAISDCIYTSFDRLLPEARSLAPGICQGWGGPPQGERPGLGNVQSHVQAARHLRGR